jgi:hypothetical protein
MLLSGCEFESGLSIIESKWVDDLGTYAEDPDLPPNTDANEIGADAETIDRARF